jgi:anthranilate phosphoribosyltransferase
VESDEPAWEAAIVEQTSNLSPTTFSVLLKKLVSAPESFSLSDMRSAFNHLAAPDGTCSSQAGAFLTALRLTGKGSDPEAFAICAEVMRSHAVPIRLKEREDGPICDIVGTGGDGHDTFNVSTTAGIVAAGAGCRVYKVV